MPTAHKNFPHFFKVLADPALLTLWKGDVVRQSKPRWMSRPYRFTGVGSVFAGGRWSVKGLMPTVYASIDPITLNAEAYYKGLFHGWTKADFNAQLIVGMHWKLQAVVDLTASATLKALKVTHREIVSCDWDAEQIAGHEPVTQAIARAAFENLAEGLIVPSARRKGGVNIVYYPSHRLDGTVIQTLDESNIPFMHGL
jgi:RES domain-containing protein